MAAEDVELTPPTVSVALERGLANWPAIRPTLTTGTPERVGEGHGHLQDDLELVSDLVGAAPSWKDSAQSPAWSRKARPAATSASAG